VGQKDLLLATTRALEEEASGLGEACVVVSTFQEADRFTPATRRRYERLAASTAFTAALGADMPVEPARGVRGAALDPGDPLRGEWDIAVLGPHYAAALVAEDLGDDGPDMDRRFRFALTFDRDLVVAVVASLMSRVVAVDVPARVATAA
jgi:DICT domain-containing protein